MRIKVGLTAGDRADNLGTHRSLVRVDRIFRLRLELRLNVHVLNDVDRPTFRRRRADTSGDDWRNERQHQKDHHAVNDETWHQS